MFNIRARQLRNLVLMIICLFAVASTAIASDTPPCTECHPGKDAGKVVHPAIGMGCEPCHTSSHNMETFKFEAGKNPQGLAASEPDLCYKCHDESGFSKKVQHLPLASGCTSCHDPHSADAPKLLKNSGQPEVCFQCHDKKSFQGASVHEALSMGCTTCHNPHSNEKRKLLVTAVPELCYGCHANFPGPKLHKPVEGGMCLACHNPHASAQKKLLAFKYPDLCYTCHQNQSVKPVVHKPVKDGDCTVCHNPHLNERQAQLNTLPPELCFQCHDRKLVSGNYVHGPVAAGGCMLCHSPHQSEQKGLLSSSVDDLCFQCHMDKQEEIKNARHVHKPVADKCTNCHSPHAAEFRYNLVAEPGRDLCAKCHPDKMAQIDKATVKHGALNNEKKCLACHLPHVSEFPKQLADQPMNLCLNCHDKTMGEGANKLTNMKAKIMNSANLHGPIKQGDCSACHDPHGSDNFRMLVKFYPNVFYAEYDTKNYSLCFNCHENTLVERPQTGTLTGFRNGKQNMHYLHVHKTTKGRTCKACHDMHGSNNPKHIRYSVPFGTSGWELPISYTKTATGGGCTSGCHQDFKYDREKPVRNRK